MAKPTRPADPHAPLTEAERGLLEAVDRDGFFNALDLPEAERVVRSAFLRALLLNRIGAKTVPEKGLRTLGLIFNEELDLRYASHAGSPLPPLFMRQAIFKRGAIFDDARLNHLDLEGSTASAGVSLHRAQITAAAWFDRLTCEGGLNLMGADIGGQLCLEGARLTGAADAGGCIVGPALSADSAMIRGGVFFSPAGDDRFVAEGEVRLLDAEIGPLILKGARLKGAADEKGRIIGRALSADRVVIKGGVFCDPAGEHRFEADGVIRLLGADIGGQLSLSGARLRGAADAGGRIVDDALSADRSVIKGSVFCDSVGDHRFEADGRICLLGVDINGQLSLKGARLRGAVDAEGRTVGDALSAEKTQVASFLFLDDRMIAEGGVNLCGARLSEVAIGGVFTRAAADIAALDFRDATMGRLFVRPSGVSGRGQVCFEGAQADTIDPLGPTRWGSAPSGDEGLELDLDGFVYRRAEFPTTAPPRVRKWAIFWGPRDPIAENVLELIDRSFIGDKPTREHYKPQPFEQAAKVLREAGHGRSADEVAVAKREFRRITRADGWIASVMSWVALVFFRYGYGPLRASAWTIGFVLLGAWVFAAIDEGKGLVVADPQKDQPAVVDSSLPDGGCTLYQGVDFSGCAKWGHGVFAAVLNAAEQPVVWGLNTVLGVPRPPAPRPAPPPGATVPAPPRACPEHPMALSLDTLLPLVDFGVEKRCRVADDYPRRGLAETFRIGFAIFGWLFIPMVALTFAGVLRKD